MSYKNKSKKIPHKNPTKLDMLNYLKSESSTILENFSIAYASCLNKCHGRARVGDSEIHGKGIFANCDIRKGQLITYYPAHFVLIKPNGYNYVDGKIQVVTISSSFSNGRQPNLKYSFVIDENLSICGDPENIDNSDFLAHMTNDAMVVSSASFGEKQNEIYEKISTIRNNAILKVDDSSCIYLLATKDIKEGDEITTPYGYNYWVRENLMKEKLNDV